MPSLLDAAHSSSVDRSHVSISHVFGSFEEFFEVRKFYCIIERAIKHTGIALTASVFIYVRAEQSVRLFHLYAYVFAGHHAGAAAVAVFILSVSCIIYHLYLNSVISSKYFFYGNTLIFIDILQYS